MRARAGLWCAVLLGLAAGPLQGSGAWREDAYVWRRRHDAALAGALAATRERVSGYLPLAAEVTWDDGGRAGIARVPPDYAALAATGRPVGLVLRAGPYAGPFAAGDTAAKTLAALAKEILGEARRAGLEPAELQIDFDCAEDRLAGYRVWLEELRAAAGGTPLVFTALPAWLRHRAEFAALAQAADGFVLQVHSLEKPTGGPDAVYTLCDPAHALAWAEQASEAGRPFRVALPTYGYRLAFDREGRFFALSAEGPAPRWPAGTQVRSVRADPAEMLWLERTLADDPPAGCEGVIWFRLPVAGDRLNWDAATFLRVLAGETPRTELALQLAWPEPRLAEVAVVNRGETSPLLPARVALSWTGAGRLIAADGLGGYELRPADGGLAAELVAGAEAAETPLAPGRTRRIAWLRFSDEISLEASFPDRGP